MTKILGLFFLFVASLQAKEPAIEGRMTSPFEACKDTIIVEKDKYEKNKAGWEKFQKDCGQKIQLAEPAGFTSLDPLKENIQYIEFAGRVAKIVVTNLEKSKLYADCSERCFAGEKTCPAEMSGERKIVQCEDRRTAVRASMVSASRKLRIEMALANEGRVNITNVLRSEPDDFINKNLAPFELGTPSPLKDLSLQDFEVREAKRRLEVDKKKLKEEAAALGLKDPTTWMAVKLMNNFEEHKKKYRQFIFQQFPIFSVIDKPKNFNDDKPVWTDEQIAKAFRKLSSNAADTKKKVEKSIANGKLEYTRMSIDALANFVNAKEPDLLYFLGMKPQVEQVLKADPASCSLVTTMLERMKSKEHQNIAAGVTVTLGSGLVAGSIGGIATAAVATGYTGLGLGMANLGDSINEYNKVKKESQTMSGLSNEEGIALRSSEDIAKTYDSLTTNLALLPLNFIGVPIGAASFRQFSKVIAQDLPEEKELLKLAETNPEAQVKLLSLWAEKLKGLEAGKKFSEALKNFLAKFEKNKTAKEVLTNIKAQPPVYQKTELRMVIEPSGHVNQKSLTDLAQFVSTGHANNLVQQQKISLQDVQYLRSSEGMNAIQKKLNAEAKFAGPGGIRKVDLSFRFDDIIEDVLAKKQLEDLTKLTKEKYDNYISLMSKGLYKIPKTAGSEMADVPPLWLKKDHTVEHPFMKGLYLITKDQLNELPDGTTLRTMRGLFVKGRDKAEDFIYKDNLLEIGYDGKKFGRSYFGVSPEAVKWKEDLKENEKLVAIALKEYEEQTAILTENTIKDNARVFKKELAQTPVELFLKAGQFQEIAIADIEKIRFHDMVVETAFGTYHYKGGAYRAGVPEKLYVGGISDLSLIKKVYAREYDESAIITSFLELHVNHLKAYKVPEDKIAYMKTPEGIEYLKGYLKNNHMNTNFDTPFFVKAVDKMKESESLGTITLDRMRTLKGATIEDFMKRNQMKEIAVKKGAAATLDGPVSTGALIVVKQGDITMIGNVSSMGANKLAVKSESGYVHIFDLNQVESVAVRHDSGASSFIESLKKANP